MLHGPSLKKSRTHDVQNLRREICSTEELSRNWLPRVTFPLQKGIIVFPGKTDLHNFWRESQMNTVR